jgi:hypothetical protein
VSRSPKGEFQRTLKILIIDFRMIN